MSAPHTRPYTQDMKACPPPPTVHKPLAEMTFAEHRAFIEASVRKNSRLTSELLIAALVNGICTRYEAFLARRGAETDATPEQPDLYTGADR